MGAACQVARLEAARSTLEVLLRTVNVTIEEVDRKISTHVKELGQRMTAIPDELLCTLLDYAATDAKSVRNISRVCRRFRRITLRSQHLWTSISSTMSDQWLEAFVARSGSLDLDISITTWQKESEGLQRIVLPESHRWKTLSFSMETFNLGDEELYHALAKMDLPRLKSLDVSASSSTAEVDYPIPHFYTTWQAPILTTVKFIGFVPLVIHSPLTHVELSLGSQSDWYRMFNFLQSTPTVTNLTFSAIIKFEDRLPRTELPSLETLFAQLTFVASSSLNQANPTFHNPLILPNLINLELGIEMQTGHWPDDFVGHPDNPPPPPPPLSRSCIEDFITDAISHKLSSLTLRMTGFPLTTISIPFSRLHGLRHLNLQTAHPIVFVPDGAVDTSEYENVPPIRVLELQQCWGTTNEWLLAVLHKLEERQDWDAFERLVVTSCPSVEFDDVVKIVPRGKLDWYSGPVGW